MIVGYTTGVFDLFHIGHLNLLRNARAMCDRLLVGVSTDALVMEYKKRYPVIPFVERCEILRGIRCVDVVVAQETMDKFAAWKKLRFDVMFVGDDWYETTRWEAIQARFEKVGVRIVYFPYTTGTSSTLINEILLERRGEWSARPVESPFAAEAGGTSSPMLTCRPHRRRDGGFDPVIRECHPAASRSHELAAKETA
jgi:glycerol-3-phosphate cytidylyltransferase